MTEVSHSPAAPEHLIRAGLRVEGLAKSFGARRVLNELDALIPPGAVTAFIGPNGAGKSTLFHTICGDLVPDAGRVFLGERDITGMATWKVARLGIGRQFQDVRVFRALSCEENVRVAAQCATQRHKSKRPHCVPAGKMERDGLSASARDFLAIVGLEAKADDAAGSLSFGSQKLLAFARLLAGDFRTLLLDEPASGISPYVLEKVGSIIRMLVRDRGLTVAMVEHNMTFVAEHADFTYVMREGRVFDHGLTADVLARPANRELCLGL